MKLREHIDKFDESLTTNNTGLPTWSGDTP